MSKNRLLIVDDEVAIARLIEQAALEVGFEVRAIFDSGDFEKGMREIRPSVIFLDIARPGRDGLELIGHLAANKFAGKFVVPSGSDKSYIQMSSTIATAGGLQVAGTLEKAVPAASPHGSPARTGGGLNGGVRRRFLTSGAVGLIQPGLRPKSKVPRAALWAMITGYRGYDAVREFAR